MQVRTSICKSAFSSVLFGFALLTTFISLAQEPNPHADLAPMLQDEVPGEELAPAATQLDVKQLAPLIRFLYQATRETKESAILAQLTEAKDLLATGADVKATDTLGRTPLHWVVFGSSYNAKPAVLVLYEEIATQLLAKGVELNRQDAYHNTALDYLLYSPNFEMQTLLLENSATSGFLEASNTFIEQIESGSLKPTGVGMKVSSTATLYPGQTIDVRLNSTVYSDRSRTGDPIEGVITYPLCKGGELVACPDGELVLSPGTRVNGTILFAQRPLINILGRDSSLIF